MQQMAEPRTPEISELENVQLLPDPDEKAGLKISAIASNPISSDLISARDSVKHHVRRLNFIIILCAILSIAFLDAAHLVLRSGEFPEHVYSIWFASHTIDIIVLTLFVSLAATILEARSPFPIFYSVLGHAILCVVVAYAAIVGGGNTFSHADWCGIDCCNWDSLVRRPGPRCNDLHVAVRLLMDLGVILAAIVSTSHFALLLLRCWAIYDTKFWRSPFPHGFAPGRFSFRVAVQIPDKSKIPRCYLERCDDSEEV
ncbi:uncharacterized protein PAC_03437 [Phialocephala subalpina]|uniref:MARVEL domain-containing protein n=1 Tax=Phialocephala subalpina TaxID=576137 RepID=A0A1L7WLB2_9HELO|nr:uncharacterized protein PAC_03437 [Phialocephala subalpina]